MSQTATPPRTPDVTDPPPWAIRPEQPLDLDPVHDLHRAAFPTAAEAELVDAIRASAAFLPELSLVAVTPDGSVLGHVMLSRVGLVDGDAPRSDVLALAPVAVLGPHRGRGIGTALVRAALAGADRREEALVVVVGPRTFFGAMGFRAAGAYGITGPYDETGETFQVRPRDGFGRGAMPAGRIVYPAAFEGI